MALAAYLLLTESCYLGLEFMKLLLQISILQTNKYKQISILQTNTNNILKQSSYR